MDEKKRALLQEALFFVGFCLASSLLGTALIQVLSTVMGLGNAANAVAALNENSTAFDRNLVRMVLMISHLFIFIIPCLLFSFWFYKKNGLQYLQLHLRPSLENLGFGGALILVTMPFAMLTYWVNQQVPISDAMLKAEEAAAEMTKHLLVMNSVNELLLTLFVVAIVPAIGEELLFRGVLQSFFSRLFKNGHAAVWLTAFLFSLIHFQMQGFLPRVLLGAVLGYTLLWTRNLWIPIFTHFVFNGVQVLAQYSGKVDIESTDVAITKLLFPSLVSAILTYFIGYRFWQSNRKTQPQNLLENQLPND